MPELIVGNNDEFSTCVEKFAVSNSESSGISNFYRAVIGARGCFSIGRISRSFYSSEAPR